MLRNLLYKVYTQGSDEDKEAVANILSLNVSDLQWSELMKIEADLDDEIAAENEPPDEEELALRHPSICEGCEE